MAWLLLILAFFVLNFVLYISCVFSLWKFSHSIVYVGNSNYESREKNKVFNCFFFVLITWPILDNSFPCGFFADTISKIKSNFLGIWNECNNLSKCSNDESNHFSKNKHFSAKCILFHLVENPYTSNLDRRSRILLAIQTK